MNKFLLLLLLFLLVIGIVAWQWNDRKKGVANPIVALLRGGETSDFVEIHDQAGRPLKCRVTAKRDPFVQVVREADGRRFTINRSSLDGPSSRMLHAMADFNEASLEEELYAQAKAAVKVELLNAPELNTFRCKYSGQNMQSEKGAELDAWRSYLQNIKVNRREVTVRLEKTGDGGLYFPEGIRDLPCVRVGEEVIYGRDSKAIRAAMIQHYMKTAMTGGSARR